MFTKQKHNKTTYGIIGLGRFGQALAEELARSGAELLVIDIDEEKLLEIREFTDNAVLVKTLDKKSILDAGIHNCDVVVVCIAEKMDVSILVTLSLIDMGIPKVIAKAASAEHGTVLEKLGAEVVYPERDMAIRIGKRLETSKMLDYIHLSEKISISKMLVPDKIIDKSVRDVDLRSKFGLIIIAIENGVDMIEGVGPDYIFRKNDILFLSGNPDGFDELTQWSNN